MTKHSLKIQMRELTENGNHYYNYILDYELERCQELNLDENIECMSYINNFIKELTRLKTLYASL